MAGEHVFLGMSGGVDSSVSALLLRQAGYQVSGVNMRLFHNEDLGRAGEDLLLSDRRGGCPGRGSTAGNPVLCI